MIKQKLDEILKHISNKDMNTDNFVFVCSIDLKCAKKEYKGYKIYFDKLLKGDMIYFMPNPYTKKL